jgi:hypothetical protein
LFIFCFDGPSYETLLKLKLENATLIPIEKFENKRLLSAKLTRSRAEYCWTCASSTIRYVFDEFKIKECTYLDADIYFFSSPLPLFEEIGNRSVLITAHNYAQKYNPNNSTERKYGKYIVQFVTVKNNKQGNKVLNWWIDRCIEWCYARIEEGKYGDQKYLETMMELFPEDVVCSKNAGAGLAPWNLLNYDFGDGIKNVIFYHFHGFKYFLNGFVQLTLYVYVIGSEAQELIYKPYLREFIKNMSLVRKFNPDLLKDSFKEYAEPTETLPNLIKEYFEGIFHSLKQLVRSGLFLAYSDRKYLRRNIVKYGQLA